MRTLNYSTTTVFPISHYLLFPYHNLLLYLHSFCKPFPLEYLMYFFHQSLKSLFDIKIGFCTDFYKRNSILFSYLCSFFLLNLSFKIKIAFGSKKYLANIWRCMCLNLLHPSLHVLEGCSINDGICQHYPSCSFVVCLSNILKSLLPSCIPYLQFIPAIINIEGFYLEIHSNGCNI